MITSIVINVCGNCLRYKLNASRKLATQNSWNGFISYQVRIKLITYVRVSVYVCVWLSLANSHPKLVAKKVVWQQKLLKYNQLILLTLKQFSWSWQTAYCWWQWIHVRRSILSRKRILLTPFKRLNIIPLSIVILIRFYYYS